VNKQFVKASIELHCDNVSPPPTYRVYVDDELFAERTYIWEEQYPVEMLQILAAPGRYCVRVESTNATITRRNPEILVGPAQWIDIDHLEIYDENQ